jgi:hypothetical protein
MTPENLSIITLIVVLSSVAFGTLAWLIDGEWPWWRYVVGISLFLLGYGLAMVLTILAHSLLVHFYTWVLA